MARYNTFRYGDGTKYGSSAAVPENIWWFTVAWDGSYTGDNEGMRCVDLSVTRGRDHLIRADGGGFEPFGVGEVVGIFDNEDGRYDPWNTSSPLYPNVTPGKFVRCGVLQSGTNYGIMRGIIDDIQPLQRNGSPHVRIVVKDALQWIKDKVVQVGLQGNRTQLQMFEFIKAVVGGYAPEMIVEWPWNARSGTSMYTTQHDYWWAWEQNSWDACRQLMDAHLSHMFHGQYGVIYLVPRDYTYAATATITEDEILRDMVLPQPWELVRNDVRFKVHPLVLNPVNTTLWSWEEVPIAIGAEPASVEVGDVIFRYQHWQPCGDSVTFDFTINTLADGSGTDLSALGNIQFTAGIGEGVEKIIVSNGSINPGYVTDLRAVGDIIYAPYTRIKSAVSATSQAAYGARTLTLDSRWMNNVTTGQSLANQLLAIFKDPKPTPTIQIENRPSLQFGYDLYERVNLSIASRGLSGYYRIGKIEHRWLLENGQAVRTTWKLEPYFVLT